MKMRYEIIPINSEEEGLTIDFGDDWNVFQVEGGVNSIIVILVKNGDGKDD